MSQTDNYLAEITQNLYSLILNVVWESNIDRLCGLAVRVPAYRTETYCASCEVRTEFIYVM
jgi:hypothetical protein